MPKKVVGSRYNLIWEINKYSKIRESRSMEKIRQCMRRNFK